MKRANRTSIIALIMLSNICFAGGREEFDGQSETHRVIIDFDTSTPEMTITKSEDGYSEYTYLVSKTNFPDECTILESNGSIVCKPAGSTIMAGTTYARTLDATPLCAGKRVDYRYTCVKGCKKIVPMYFSIIPYEC